MRLNIGQTNNDNRININADPPTSTGRVDVGTGSNNNRIDVGTGSNTNRIDVTGNVPAAANNSGGVATITTSITETNMSRITGDELTLFARETADEVEAIYRNLRFGKIDFGSIEDEIPLQEKFYVTDITTEESISDRKLNPTKYPDPKRSSYDYFILNDRYLVINGFIFNAITQEYQGQLLSPLGQVHTGIRNIDDLARSIYRLTQPEFFNQKQIAYNSVEQDIENQYQAEYERTLRIAVDQENNVSAQAIDRSAIQRAILKELTAANQLESETVDAGTSPILFKSSVQVSDVIKLDAFQKPEVKRNPAGTIISETDTTNVNIFVGLQKAMFYQDDNIIDTSITELLVAEDTGPDVDDLQNRIDELERRLRDATISNQDKDRLISELQRLLNAQSTAATAQTERLDVDAEDNDNRLDVLPETNTNRLAVTRSS